MPTTTYALRVLDATVDPMETLLVQHYTDAATAIEDAQHFADATPETRTIAQVVNVSGPTRLLFTTATAKQGRAQ